MTAPSIAVLAKRLAAVEARLSEIETGYNDSLYKRHQKATYSNLAINKILNHLSLSQPTEEEIDIALDEE